MNTKYEYKFPFDTFEADLKGNYSLGIASKISLIVLSECKQIN